MIYPLFSPRSIGLAGLALAFTLAAGAAACGSSEPSRAGSATDEPSPTEPGGNGGGGGSSGASSSGSSGSGSGTDGGSLAADAGADGAASTSRAKCGAPPYDWLPATTMGNVLESATKAPHTPLELNYALIEARNQNAFKSRRIAKHGTKSKLVRYQTQDRGKAIDATTLMAYPDVSGTQSFPILLVLHGTAGFYDGCAPSGGAADDTFGGFTDGTSVLLSLFASFGYIVVAPDYIGLKSLGAPTGFLHPYLVAEPTAIASLDAVRAAKKQLAGSNVTPGEVVVVGGSQGGHAAAFVNRYQPHYAPELVIRGSVWDVPPTDILGQAKPALTAWKNATKNLIALTTTYESWYGTAAGGLSSAFLPPYDTTVPAALATSCSPSAAFTNATRETMFTTSFLTNGQLPGFGGLAPWACYLSENSLPTTTIPKQESIPSMFLIGENDELVDNVVERASFQKLCTQGHVLTFLECAGASHTKPLSYALDEWLDFLEDRLAGTPVTGSCVLAPARTCTSTP